LRAIREALKAVRLDSPPCEIEAAVEAVRALLDDCAPPSRHADGADSVPF